MGLLDRIRGRLTRQMALTRLTPTGGGFSYSNGTLASNETIFSAISMLSGAIASLPVSMRRKSQRIQPEEHPVARLLEYGPNPNMTAFEFIRCMECLRDSAGAGYALKELDSYGQIVGLWPMRTENVTPKRDRDTQELYYEVRDNDGAELACLHNSFVLSVTHIGTDGITPINPIQVLRSSLEYDREVKEFSINQMKNGLRANVAMNISSLLGPEQIELYDKMFREFNRRGVIYLDKGKTLTELKGANIIDPKVFEVENITIARVARVFTIPLEKFLPEKASYSSAEQSDLNYLRDTVLPMVRMYEQEFSKTLLSSQERAEGMQIKFSLNGFARADMQTRGEFYQKGIRNGWFCVDEVRELEDMPPVPEGMGKVFYISKDLVPVNQPASSESDVPLGTQGGREQIAQVSLNGAQISSILEITQSVAAGRMNHESAITLLTSAFPFQADVARKILGVSSANAPLSGPLG